MNLFTLEPFIERALKVASAEDLKFSISYPGDTNFPKLVQNTGCVDRGNYISRWNPKSFLSYGGTEYKVYRLPIGVTLDLWDALAYFGKRSRIPAATTRELVAFIAQHPRFARKAFKSNKEFVSVGKDDFTVMDYSVSVVRIEKGKRVLRPLLPSNTAWTSSHLFLFRD